MTGFPERLEGEGDAAHLARVQTWMKGADVAAPKTPATIGSQQAVPLATPPLIMDAETVKAIGELGQRAGAAQAALDAIVGALASAPDLISVARTIIAIANLDSREPREVCPALHKALIAAHFAKETPRG